MKYAKLTELECHDILEMYQTGISQRALAEMYGVSRATIRRVVNDPDILLPKNRPTSGPVGQPKVGHSDFPDWLGVWLIIGAAAGAGLVGWVIYHAVG